MRAFVRLREISAEHAAAITADPKAYYVNLHTSDFPAGEVRGQLKYVPGSETSTT